MDSGLGCAALVGGQLVSQQGELFAFGKAESVTQDRLCAELLAFREFDKSTLRTVTRSSRGDQRVATYVNEFWTSRQRAAHSLHELSYRACFKPQLPRFFIDRLTEPGDRVYDPFMGRGTTLLEAALRGRVPVGCDINPLSSALLRPRLDPPELAEIEARLGTLAWDLVDAAALPEELLTFYHPETLVEICSLRQHLLDRERAGQLDRVDAWIRMVAVNRLTGHSPGFFSVYTLPPNQATSVAAQQKINAKRNQVPPRREVPERILRKSKSLLVDCDAAVRSGLADCVGGALLLTGDCADTPEIEAASVRLVVTSPPFLDVVQYAADNWLRCWFCGIETAAVKAAIHRRVEDWQAAMTRAFEQFHRVVSSGGFVAFEVGEVRKGAVALEQVALCCGVDAGFVPELVLINDQQFTKTANCWGVKNNRSGTNTNRIVLFRRK